VVDSVFYRVRSLFDDQFRVQTCQVEGARSCPVIQEYGGVECGYARVVIEELYRECSAINSGRLGYQVFNAPNLVNLRSS
jgi:hypothetical protein